MSTLVESPELPLDAQVLALRTQFLNAYADWLASVPWYARWYHQLRHWHSGYIEDCCKGLEELEASRV